MQSFPVSHCPVSGFNCLLVSQVVFTWNAPECLLVGDVSFECGGHNLIMNGDGILGNDLWVDL